MTTDRGARGGVFIVFEGGDGAGKTTQIQLLAAALKDGGQVDRAGSPVLVLTREPGGTPVGAGIRELLLHGPPVSPRAEALAYAADRADHVERVIAPALARGHVVVCDRYVDSSIAYQSEGRALNETDVRSINKFATGGLVPDLTVLLDLPAGVGRQRVLEQGAPDRLEDAGLDFHERVNARYRALAAAEPGRYAVIDAAQGRQEVAAQVLAAVERVLAARRADRGEVRA
jgi:dTMP kinase